MIRWHEPTTRSVTSSCTEQPAADSGSLPGSSVGNSVPLLGPLIRNANSCDEQKWLPLLRNVPHAVISEINGYIYPTLACPLFVVGTEVTADGWLWSGNWRDFRWWRVSLLSHCAGVWSSISSVYTVFTLILQCLSEGIPGRVRCFQTE